MDIRKNQANLTSDEKDEFIETLLKFKKDGNSESGRNYDTFVKWHIDEAMPAHNSPQFLPWHRVFLRLLEKDLKQVSGNEDITIPYWDWTTDNQDNSSLWDGDFLGGNGDVNDDWKVTSGRFVGNAWKLTHNQENGEPSNKKYLRRAFGELTCELPSSRDVMRTLEITPYDSAPWNGESENKISFRNSLEGWAYPFRSQMHNRGHVWVGGSMLEMSSPNDPVFFLHHCNVDRVWASWQRLHPSEGYATNSVDGPLEKLPPFLRNSGEPYTVSDVENIDKTGVTYDSFLELPVESLTKNFRSTKGFYE